MDGFHIDYSKLNNLIIRKRIFIKEYPLEMLEAEKKIGRELKAALVEATSNTAYKQRHRPPYPYSPKVNTPPIPKELVNMQTGNLNKSWVARTIGTVNGITTSIYNTKN